MWAARLNKPALLALTASADFTARVWDALTGDELHLFQHKHIVRTCHFTEDLTRVMTGGMEKIIRIFDLNRPEADPFCIHGSESGIRCGLFGMDDTILFTALSNNSGVWYDTWFCCPHSVSSPSAVGLHTHTHTHTHAQENASSTVVRIASAGPVSSLYWCVCACARASQTSDVLVIC